MSGKFVKILVLVKVLQQLCLQMLLVSGLSNTMKLLFNREGSRSAKVEEEEKIQPLSNNTATRRQ
jgi:hypothetical protein